MRVGILIPQTGPWEVMRDRCLTAERLGFETLWVGDHYFVESMPHVELLDAVTVLGALAVSVPRIRFGALTTNIIYRNPAVIAKQAASLDVLSGGRFEVGLGAGVYQADHRMTGSEPWSARERVDRFAEVVTVVDRLLRGERVDHAGRHYNTEGAIVRPRPVQRPRPPITIGANGPRMIGIAAHYADRWNTWGGRGLSAEALWSTTAERVQSFDRAIEGSRRAPDSVIRSLYVFRPLEPWRSVDAFRSIVGRARDIGLDELLFAWPGFLEETGADRGRDVLEAIAGTVLPELAASR